MLIFIKYFVDKEDYDSVALEGIDLENFDDPYPLWKFHIVIFKMNEDMIYYNY